MKCGGALTVVWWLQLVNIEEIELLPLISPISTIESPNCRMATNLELATHGSQSHQNRDSTKFAARFGVLDPFTAVLVVGQVGQILTFRVMG